MIQSKSLRRPAVILLACAGLAGPAWAGAATVRAPAPVAPTFSAEDLQAYAGALVDLDAMRAKVAVQAAKLPPDQRSALDQQAASAMLAIVQRHGLDTATFNAISQAVERDSGLRNRVRQAMMNKAIGT